MKSRLKQIIILISLITIHQSLITKTVYAVCPVCTIAVGAGLGISRALGIDDAVTSVWIGGLILFMSFWFIVWFQKKKSKLLTTNYQFLFIFATAIGSLVFLLAKWADGKVRKVKGKQLFIYQKVVFPVVSLILSSVVLHFLI